MTREELLEACFGRSDFPAPLRTVELRDEETGDVWSHVDVYLRRVLIRYPSSPAAVADGGTTLVVAGIAQVCTDPDKRGNGYALALVRRAHAEMKEHHAVKFAALYGLPEIYERLGYFHPEGASDPNFLVCKLDEDEQWPEGRVLPQGNW